MTNRRHWITIRKEDYDAVDAILAKLYQEGYIDSVRVDYGRGNGQIMIGVECSFADLFVMKDKFTKSGIIFQ